MLCPLRYALGVILYQILNGSCVLPYVTADEREALFSNPDVEMQERAAIMQMAPGVMWPYDDLKAMYDPKIVALVEGLLHRDPALRFGMDEVSVTCLGFMLIG